MRWSHFFYACPAVFAMVFCALLTVNAEDNQKDKGTGTGTGSSTDKGSGRTIQGRITKVDMSKKEITLAEARTGTDSKDKGTGTGTTDKGTSTDKNTTDKGTGTDKNTTDKGTGTGTDKNTTDKGTGSGTGSNSGHSMTFRIVDSTKITVDGKEGKFTDLKEGQMARVTARSDADNQQKDKKSDKSDTTTKDKGDATSQQTMTAERIEVTTRNP